MNNNRTGLCLKTKIRSDTFDIFNEFFCKYKLVQGIYVKVSHCSLFLVLNIKKESIYYTNKISGQALRMDNHMPAHHWIFYLIFCACVCVRVNACVYACVSFNKSTEYWPT